MSIGARIALVRPGGGLVFQAASQRTDLINPLMTQTQMIAGLQWLVAKGHILAVTAVRSDHHDDSYLSPDGVGTHARGYAIDCWPLQSKKMGDWVPVAGPEIETFLRDARLMPYIMQIGLTADCYSSANIAAAGPSVYLDDGGPHAHLGFRLHVA